MNVERQSDSFRRGARRGSDITADVRRRLNAGDVETLSLVEIFAVDFAVLMGNVFPELATEAFARISGGEGITRRMQRAGQLLFEKCGLSAFTHLACHRSDTVRGWAAYLVAAVPDINLETRLETVKCLADDHHFGVREWAWLAVRPHIAGAPARAIELLSGWARDPALNLRRFAVESTRPRGVWSVHIRELKTRPESGLPLLDPNRADSSRYLQDSVANWLNDAAKTRRDWVEDLCQRWLVESDNPATTRICRRALRSAAVAQPAAKA